MTADRQIDPGKALERFFDIVREEASHNPRLAARLTEALGYTVIFRGTEAKNAVDPIQVALAGEEEFRRTFLTFSDKDLKAIITSFNLATKADLAKRKGPQLVDLMWAGAKAQIKDRGLHKSD